MSTSEREEECFFKCSKPGKTDKISAKRIESIISASKLRNDDIYETLEQRFSANPNLVIHCHRTCVSTYTSKTHINRAFKRTLPKEDLSLQNKRVLRSEPDIFKFRKNCFLCGEECIDRDPKNPSRYNPYFLVRTIQYKTGILDVCNKRHDKWAEEVQLRVLGASSDLHAADARYHWKCHKLFTSDRNIRAAKNKVPFDDLREDDIAFNEVTQEMTENSVQTWNSVELHCLYLSFGGSTLSRRAFVQKLQEYFGKELLVLSSPGIASLILFRKHCTTTLITTENDEDIISEHVKPLASVIRKETLNADKSKYHVHINISTVRRECSQTLLHLLNELKIPDLAALAIGSIVASCLKKAPVQLQVAFSNLLKKKSIIEELSHFRITTTYDEHKRFRASVAKACSATYSLRGIKEGKGLVQVVGDNFDAAICSENGLQQTHAMGMILTKFQQDTVNKGQEITTIPRIPKNEVTLPPEPDVTIARYKGPKKVPMPSVSLAFSIPPLKLLALAVCEKVSVMNAQNKDFKFLKLVTDSADALEYNGFNTKVSRESRHEVANATQVMYLPLIDLPPTNHDTVLTCMLEAKRLTNECGQPFVVFTADQAIYKVVVDVIWNDPEKFSNFVPRLGGMHTLMSFIGCVGSLMAGSGIVEILECAFAGVLQMLKGKKFPQNMRALRLLAEEVLRPFLEENDVTSFDHMIAKLEEKCTQSRTTRLWVYSFIKPILLMMNFVRAEREADWCLHLWCVVEMLPYFAAAGHWNYLRYASVYLMFMEKMPRKCLDHFVKGEHVMRHRSGYWNGIWSDMMIESTFMRYGHGERGTSLTGLTLNREGVKRWALSMHVTSQLVSDLCEMGEHKSPEKLNLHKEEGKGRISRDAGDREKIRRKLELCIQPLNPSEHPQGLVNIVSGKVASKGVNVDKAYEMGTIAARKFKESLPSGFHVGLHKSVVNMNEKRDSGKCQTAMQMDTTLLYSKVIALQANRGIKMADVLKYELASVPPSMFKDDGSMREAVGKSVLMNTMSVSQSVRTSKSPSLILIDGCALLWVVQWPVGGTVCDFMKNFLEKVLDKLKNAHVYLVFDRYQDYSIKSATRASRGKQGSRKFILTETRPLPPQNVTLSNNENKRQLIQLLCNYVSTNVCNVPFENRLVVTGQDLTPFQIQRGNLTQRTDLKTEHEEADIIMIQQLIVEVKGKENEIVHVICDDTDVFVLLLYYYHRLGIKNEVCMVSLKPGRASVDIKETVSKYENIISSLPAAHALSGCDSVAPLHGIGKKRVLKCLQAGKQLQKLGHIESCMAEVMKECTTFIASCYGIEGAVDMTEVRISLWAKKIGHAQLRAPSFSSLPPTRECFAENVRRAHFQAILWLSANSPLLPRLDPTSFGWQRDEANKELYPIAIPQSTPIAPDYIIAMTKCSCRSDEPCITTRCNCRGNNISCSLMCQCFHEGEKCCNPHTKIAESITESDSEEEF